MMRRKTLCFLTLFSLSILFACAGNPQGRVCENDEDCQPGAPEGERFTCLSKVCRKVPIQEGTENDAGEKRSQEETPLPDPITQDRGDRNDDRTAPDTLAGLTITKIEGEGSKTKLAYPKGAQPPPKAVEATQRFQRQWIIYGMQLDRLTGLRLEALAPNCATPPRQCKYTAQDGLVLGPVTTEGTLMKRTLTLPKTLFAGFFTIVALVGTQTKTMAQVYVLQGEKGDSGKDGNDCQVANVGSDAQGNTTVTFKCGSQTKTVTVNRGKQGKDGNGCDVTKQNSQLSFKCGPGQGAKNTQATVNELPAASSQYLTALQSKVRVTAKGLSLGTSATKPELTVANGIVTVQHANLLIQNGLGKTDAVTNGKGNLILGYNETNGRTVKRTGSHNLIVGIGHSYTSYSGVLFGLNSTVEKGYCSVLGGKDNTAKGSYSSVSGGTNNTAQGSYSSVSGGTNNTAQGSYSSVSGGTNNTASGDYASVSGGSRNKAEAESSSVLGGDQKKISNGAKHCLPACGKAGP